MKFRMDHPPPEDKNHRLQSVVLFVLLALCGMVWYTRLSSTTRNLSGQSPSILLRKTVLSLKSPTGAFIVPLRSTNAKLAISYTYNFLSKRLHHFKDNAIRVSEIKSSALPKSICSKVEILRFR